MDVDAVTSVFMHTDVTLIVLRRVNVISIKDYILPVDAVLVFGELVTWYGMAVLPSTAFRGVP